MSIRLENIGVAVHDLDEAIAFFTDLGLSLIGQDTVNRRNLLRSAAPSTHTERLV